MTERKSKSYVLTPQRVRKFWFNKNVVEPYVTFNNYGPGRDRIDTASVILDRQVWEEMGRPGTIVVKVDAL